MKRWSAIAAAVFVVGLVALALPQAPQQAAAQGAGWVTLFDGKNLDNWSPIGTAIGSWRTAPCHNRNGLWRHPDRARSSNTDRVRRRLFSVL
jgi:hypothetical protein